jgi:hypothetical protein
MIPYAVSFIIYIAFHILLFNLVNLESLKLIKVIYILTIEALILYRVYKLDFLKIISANNQQKIHRDINLFPKVVLSISVISWIACMICVFSFLLISELIFVNQPFTNLDFLFALAGVSPQVCLSAVLMIKFERSVQEFRGQKEPRLDNNIPIK